MLISKDHFIGELYIEGLAGQSATATLISKQVEALIEKREKQFLQQFLGCLYEPFMEFVDGDLDDDSPFYRLYEYLTCTSSPIAYYVYFYYIRQVNSMVTANGVRKDRTNAFNANEKLVSTWNDMADINREIDKYLHKEFKEYKTNEYLLMYTNSLL